MIWESHPWRAELCRVADGLGDLREGLDWEDEDLAFAIERDVMVSAYAIRKLIEAQKVAKSTLDRHVSAETFALKDRVPDLMNWHHLDRFYDFESPKEVAVAPVDVCNQLIHSFIFVRESDAEVPDHDTAGLRGFFVASDRARSAQLYRFDIDDLIALLVRVGNEEVVSTRMTRDAQGQWQVINLTSSDVATERTTQGRSTASVAVATTTERTTPLGSPNDPRT